MIRKVGDLDVVNLDGSSLSIPPEKIRFSGFPRPVIDDLVVVLIPTLQKEKGSKHLTLSLVFSTREAWELDEEVRWVDLNDEEDLVVSFNGVFSPSELSDQVVLQLNSAFTIDFENPLMRALEIYLTEMLEVVQIIRKSDSVELLLKLAISKKVFKSKIKLQEFDRFLARRF